MERLKNISLVLFFALFVASLCFNVHNCTTKHGVVYRDTVLTTLIDTIQYYKPVPRDSVVIRYVTQRLPVVDDKEENFTNKGNNDEQNITKSKNNVAENIPDSENVVIPITQKIYEDSSYTAYVSGYNPQLDSLIFRMPREVITIKEYHKPKRWGIGIQAGYGVTVKGTPQFCPYIGVGVSYNLFHF